MFLLILSVSVPYVNFHILQDSCQEINVHEAITSEANLVLWTAENQSAHFNRELRKMEVIRIQPMEFVRLD